MRVLHFDIENSPAAAFVWGPAEPWIPHDRFIHEPYLYCWAAKWDGERGILSDTITGEESLRRDDSRICQSLADLIREADVVVAHNGDRFDIPKLSGRLIQHGLEPLGPVKSIDTLKLAKKSVSVAYRKLDYLGEILGFGKKIKTDWDLWERCYNGDELALAQMTRYNKRDVVLLEKVFHALKPFARQLPRLHDGEGQECPSCGSKHLQRRGFYRTNASTFPKFQCKDCGRYSRGRKAEPEKLEVHPL